MAMICFSVLVTRGVGEKAARDVQASPLLDKIAYREAVGATQGEVDRKVQRIARQPGGRDSGRDGVNPQT